MNKKNKERKKEIEGWIKTYRTKDKANQQKERKNETQKERTKWSDKNKRRNRKRERKTNNDRKQEITTTYIT